MLGNYRTQYVFHISLVAQLFSLRTTKLNPTRRKIGVHTTALPIPWGTQKETD